MFGTFAFSQLPFTALDADLLPVFAEQVIYASSHAFITEPSDTPENIYFESRLKTPLVFERSIMSGDVVGAAASVGFGSIELENSDGFYDAIVRNHAIDGRRVTLKMGDPGPDFFYDDFGIIFDGAAAGWAPSETAIKVALRDWGYKLEVPIARNYYTGTGGNNGTADMAGKPIPQCWGSVSNIPLVLVDPIALRYQAHDGPVKAVDVVRDRGVALTPVTQYTVDLANGVVTLLQNPAGQITADVRGSNQGGVYVETTADIIERILVQSADWDGANYKASTFAAMNTAQPAPVSYFIADDVTIAQVMDELIDGVGGYRDFTRDGLLEIGIVALPSGEVEGIFTEVEVFDIQRLDPPTSFYPPVWRQRVGYQKNWTVQATDLAGAVTATERAFLAEEYRFGGAQDSGVKVSFLLAQDAEPKRSFFVSKVDADVEALRLLEIFKEPRSFYQFKVKTQPFTLNIGATIWVQFPKWDLYSGKLMRVLGVRDDAPNSEVTLTAFL